MLDFFEMPVIINARTGGDGLWSMAKELITIFRLDLRVFTDDDCYNNQWGELLAYFETDNWNVREKGLIYTDKLWLESFKTGLYANYGFKPSAIKDIGYSEQGMQGINFVSMGVGINFINEWHRVHTRNNKQ